MSQGETIGNFNNEWDIPFWDHNGQLKKPLPKGPGALYSFTPRNSP